MAKIEGVYVPSLYTVEYNEDGTIAKFFPKEESIPSKIKKRTVGNLDEAFYPASQIVPNIQIVHDRIALEIMRGCKHACSFCQAQAIYRPPRQRSKERILDIARESYAMTGHDEISLLSLSSVDHTCLKGIIEALNGEFSKKSVSISVPSLRVEDALRDLPILISKVKKSGLTFAPESGSERLRKAMNKNIDIVCLGGHKNSSGRISYKKPESIKLIVAEGCGSIVIALLLVLIHGHFSTHGCWQRCSKYRLFTIHWNFFGRKIH